jgi:hypothetical protein
MFSVFHRPLAMEKADERMFDHYISPDFFSRAQLLVLGVGGLLIVLIETAIRVRAKWRVWTTPRGKRTKRLMT